MNPSLQRHKYGVTYTSSSNKSSTICIWSRSNKYILIMCDAEAILNIHMPAVTTEDFWICLLGSKHYEMSGIFSVHSAYKLVLHHPQSKGRSGSCLDGAWDRAVYVEHPCPSPPKKSRFLLGNLLLKACPCRKLLKKEYRSNPTYNICGLASEDGYYAVIDRTKAQCCSVCS